jgi:cold shock CspA family protein
MLFDDRAIDAHIRRESLRRSSSQSASAPRRQSLETKNVYLGTVLRWNVAKGYGFLLSHESSEDIAESGEVFCHKSNLPPGVEFLVPNQRVEFQLTPSRRPSQPHQARVLRVIEAVKAALG